MKFKWIYKLAFKQALFKLGILYLPIQIYVEKKDHEAHRGAMQSVNEKAYAWPAQVSSGSPPAGAMGLGMEWGRVPQGQMEAVWEVWHSCH